VSFRVRRPRRRSHFRSHRPGPAGLAGIRILRWGRQIIPALGETWLTGDDTVLDIPERLGVMDSPHTLTVAGYNDDDLYPHTVTIHLDVLPVDRGSAQQGGGMLGRLRDALGL